MIVGALEFDGSRDVDDSSDILINFDSNVI